MTYISHLHRCSLEGKVAEENVNIFFPFPVRFIFFYFIFIFFFRFVGAKAVGGQSICLHRGAAKKCDCVATVGKYCGESKLNENLNER